MKKHFFTWVFIALCLLPGLGMLVLGPSPLLANETAPRTPALNTHFFSDLTDYIGSHFAFRPYLVSARSFLFERLLKSSAEEQVVLGSDAELYYTSTMEDYAGESLPEEDLVRIAQHLRELQDETEARGAAFLFTVAPNKNTLIPERMPRRIPSSHETSNLEKLKPLLLDYGVHTVDLQEIFTGRPELYYRSDSHWTAEGAAHAADALLSGLGVNRRFAEGPFAEEGLHVGDLYQMLYPTGRGREAELVYAPGFTFEADGDTRGGNAITIRTHATADTHSDPRSLRCLRDSFGIALYPYLAEVFGSAVFSRSQDYSVEAFAAMDEDIVILEIVERNLSLLLSPSEEGSGVSDAALPLPKGEAALQEKGLTA